MMLISGDVARLAESVAGRRLYPELIGIEHPRRHGGFYLYSNFDSHREHLADARSIHTGTDLATTLLEQYGIATLPASAFGESDETLAPRLATSQLYGDSDHKTETALSHPHQRHCPGSETTSRSWPTPSPRLPRPARLTPRILTRTLPAAELTGL